MEFIIPLQNGVEAKLYLYKDGKDQQIQIPFPSGNIRLKAKAESSPIYGSYVPVGRMMNNALDMM
jgi:hypothetical protein